MSQTDTISLEVESQQLITSEQAWHYKIVPKSEQVNNSISFYTDEDAWTESLQSELEMLFGKPVVLDKCHSEVIRQTLGKYYRKGKSNGQAKQKSINAADAEDFVQRLIAEADDIGSSDIHIESYEEKCRVRLRIDGKLVERYVIPGSDYPALVNKLKIRANLDIAEKRLPQDGRIQFNSGKVQFDIRVSVLPTLHGEKVVMRLLSRDATNIDIKKMGLQPIQLQHYMEGARKSHGIILISGPTGSGKTTTLYATLKVLNEETTNIVTVEDPIEYTLEGINQVQLKEDIGLTFASALRSFLRQDPDIIMLGEIRDKETAQMAIRAALTGHLVLSTIHTNSAWGTVSRLVDMGVPSYLLASTLNVTVAQRLVRLLCPNCKQSEPFDQKLFPGNFLPPQKTESHCRPVGCDHCHFTGYKGRKAVYEVIPIDADLSKQIKENNYEVGEQLESKKITRLMDNAFHLFHTGETTIEEVYSILMSNY